MSVQAIVVGITRHVVGDKDDVLTQSIAPFGSKWYNNADSNVGYSPGTIIRMVAVLLDGTAADVIYYYRTPKRDGPADKEYGIKVIY